jgi:hypothetical protein
MSVFSCHEVRFVSGGRGVSCTQAQGLSDRLCYPPDSPPTPSHMLCAQMISMTSESMPLSLTSASHELPAHLRHPSHGERRRHPSHGEHRLSPSTVHFWSCSSTAIFGPTLVSIFGPAPVLVLPGRGVGRSVCLAASSLSDHVIEIQPCIRCLSRPHRARLSF